MLQDRLDRVVFHPLAARLAIVLARTSISPNAVSVAGAFLIVCAGVVYVLPVYPGAALLGLAIHLGWHVLDGADGDLARMTGRASPAGEIIDGVCDYAGHAALYLILAAHLSQSIGPAAWIVAVAAGISRVFQAAFYEAQRRQFLQWVEGTPFIRSTGTRQAGPVLGWLGSCYVRLVDRIAPEAGLIDAVLFDADRALGLRQRLESIGTAGLSGNALLGANCRTVALGLSMLAGSPLWYFLYEVTVLNAVLLQARHSAKHNLISLREVV